MSPEGLADIAAVVVGGLGTDIFASGLDRIIGAGELEFGGRLHIGAGGKSRNIAQMMAVLLGHDRVAMVGRTSCDPLNLWKVPVDALQHAGVNTDFIKVVPFEETGKYPQIALIAVDRQGNNQIYVVPGINEDFSPQDVSAALPVFEAAQASNGVLVLSLELPLATAIDAVKQANACGLKVMLDPGGIRTQVDHNELLSQEIFLIKPNEHETEILTGMKVRDASDVKAAAHKFLNRGAANVLLTLGSKGAYLVSKDSMDYIPIPSLGTGEACDETGCGDQTMAALAACILDGEDLRSAARHAVLAGTLQFHRTGIVPVSMEELKVHRS